MAFKQGFRWRPVTQNVPTTSTALVTPWTASPAYIDVPSDPYTPTGSGLDEPWTAPDTPTTLPWSVAPTPVLSTNLPRAYWKYDPTLDLRRDPTYSKSKDRNVRSQQSSSTVRSRPSTRGSTTRPRPTPPAPPVAPAPLAPPAPPLVIAPVQLTGVPGSTYDGVDTVSVDINNIYLFHDRILSVSGFDWTTE